MDFLYANRKIITVFEKDSILVPLSDAHLKISTLAVSKEFPLYRFWGFLKHFLCNKNLLLMINFTEK